MWHAFRADLESQVHVLAWNISNKLIVSPLRIAAFKTAPICVHEWEGLGLRLATPAVMASPSRASGALETSEMRDDQKPLSLFFPTVVLNERYDVSTFIVQLCYLHL